jgi:hypothetical protein
VRHWPAFLLISAFAIPTRAEDKALHQDVIRRAMDESLAKQRDSVRRQMESAIGGPSDRDTRWFTVPWSRDKEGAFLPPVVPVTPMTAPTESSPRSSNISVQSFCPPVPMVTLENEIRAAEQRHGLDGAIIRAVIQRESAFDPCAVSNKGALGLMQLMPATAASLGVEDPFDPVQNIRGGAKYLAQLLARYGGDWRRALAAYNAGPTPVDTYGGIPPFAETQDFVDAILGAPD